MNNFNFQLFELCVRKIFHMNLIFIQNIKCWSILFKFKFILSKMEKFILFVVFFVFLFIMCTTQLNSILFLHFFVGTNRNCCCTLNAFDWVYYCVHGVADGFLLRRLHIWLCRWSENTWVLFEANFQGFYWDFKGDIDWIAFFLNSMSKFNIFSPKCCWT